MSTLEQLIHIAKTFGLKYALTRIKDALKAKLNEHFRNRQHKKRLRSLNKKEKIIVSCVGKLFELKTSDFGLHRDLISDRIREPVATALMMQYAQPQHTLLDAGANIGYFSLLLSDKCKYVYAVEPDKDNYKALIRNIELNRSKNINVFNLAFSDNSEDLYLNKSDKSNWHTTSKQYSQQDSEKIKAISIDSFCSEKGIAPDIIKMDIEGFEKIVIPGAKKILNTVSYLFFELHSSLITIEETNHILDIIEDAGLELSHIIRYDRPGLWKEEDLDLIQNIRLGDYGVYEMIFSRQLKSA